MMKLKYYFVVLLITFTCIDKCRSVANITGVSHLCLDPYGRLGRCISIYKSHRYGGCNRNPLTWPCPYGRGRPPYVCCVFGKRIVFPDDDDEDLVKKPATRNLTSRPLQNSYRYAVGESSNSGTSFPNGNYNEWLTLGSSSHIGPTVASITMLANKNKMNLLPTTEDCGPLSLGDKIHGGDEAQLGEFPWLVNLEYRMKDGYLIIACAGNILNHRYVLTAGHCVVGNIEKDAGKLESLRAGDHNVATIKDCDKFESCIDPYQRFLVIERWVHEQYNVSRNNKIINDIALLKTDRSMIYSTSIAPVCLPSIMPALEPPKSGTRLTVAGWGRSENANYTDEKRIVDVVSVEDAQCRIYNGDTSRLCAGGELGKDSCEGDSGGGLCRRTADGWVIEGIVSYGLDCGTDRPAAYARVRTYLQWILHHIEEP